MIHVEVSVPVNAPQTLVWEEITQWEKHSQWIPFTNVTVLDAPEPPAKVGTRFVGRTGIGALAFDDEMTVVRCVSPQESGEDGKCWISKNSPHLQGNAYFHVAKTDEVSCSIIWIENIILPRHLSGNLITSALSWLGNIVFRRSLNRFARQVERTYREEK